MEVNEFCQNMIELEINASKLYIEFSKICDGRIKDTMIDFSKEEIKHQETLRKLFDTIENNIELNNEVLLLIEQQKKSFDLKEEHLIFKNDKEIFLFALSIEQNSINLYSKVLPTIKSDSDEYIMFEDIINQEKKHMLYILKTIHELK